MKIDLSKLPFSTVRRISGTIYLSGELGFTPEGVLADGINAQTAAALARIEATLKKEGVDRHAVISCTCYLADLADMAVFNEVYGEFFAKPRPVRTTVQAALALDARVEITVIARANPS